MPTKNPRVNVVLEPELYKTVSLLAKEEKISLSAKTRDLVKEAIEIYGDIYWDKIAEKREKSLKGRKSLSHRDVWK
ncbi:MAG: toxin-antitoxin system, antitoxin component [Candidatus Omnitrophica bacterium]|nr:toxin-antitoxin system, antitoxin component [Candidatus Omnitrophota bacterium]